MLIGQGKWCEVMYCIHKRSFSMLLAFIMFFFSYNQQNVFKHLLTGTEEITNFVSPRTSMFPEAEQKEK